MKFVKKMLLLAPLCILGGLLFFRTHKSHRYPHLVFKDSSVDFQLIRTIGYSSYQMADPYECLVTANRIQEDDNESWYQEWHALAERTHRTAEACMKNGHPVSAYNAFLRASNYYRTSDFYLHGNQKDLRIQATSRNSRSCFTQALALAPISATAIHIPYEDTTLPGYFYHVDNKKRPTLIVQTGLDGTQEELFGYALEGLKRGYHVVTFEGPGQGSVIREQKIPFRADWENVIRPVVDFVIAQPEVDQEMIILYGLSLGGYLGPRGASGDSRIKILIANGGIYDLLEGIVTAYKSFGLSRSKMAYMAQHQSGILNNSINALMKINTKIRRVFEHGMFCFQVKTPGELIRKYADYTMHEHAPLIKCTTLICDSEDELSVLIGQSQLLFNHLTCPKTMILFKRSEGVGLHCQIGGLALSNQRIFDWLDKTVHEFSVK